MKRITGVLLSACMVAANSTPAYAERSVKVGKGISKAGRTLPTTLNTILSGVGTPSTSLGHDGDFYIDRKSWRFFGPKTKGRWPLPVLLIGPTGSPGATGAMGPIGPQGKTGLRGEGGTNGATGLATITAGSEGPMGPSGPAGSPGPMGPTGATGAAGPMGPSGSSGPPGATGAAGSSGLPGPTGPAGATGAQGIQGEIGPTGASGATGTVGPRGPSNVSSIVIPSFLLASAIPNSDGSSSAFGNLGANENYQFMLVLHGKGSSPSNRAFAFSIGGTSTVIVVSDSSVNESIYYDKSGLVSAHEYTFRGFGTATGGASGGSLYVTVTDGSGITGSNPMTMTGICTLQQIEAIT